VHAVKARYEERGSLGMINMQERTSAINGTFTIHSEVGHGAEVVLSLPLRENLLSNSKDN
jgi:signal transduction histidine kinase